MNQLITTCSATAHDPDDYDKRFQQLENRHHQLENKQQSITRQIKNIRHRRAQAIEVRDYLATQPPLEYSDQAWNTLVDHATITDDGTIEIQFKA
ncbi:MAG: hypothetical protein SPK50_09695 [Mobiluncus porci]|uniref:hypothetical protein n=1 Tax=Mobiluncus porci TaxID=2652278 RepID=UPI0023F395B6|nr:hypothetical protein [Mobiluncus porci]MDD7541913.1 hypothetical protein [Mobiluncus porci]MDY5749383.1 hypothetical protein [Mobiluncus porci]